MSMLPNQRADFSAIVDRPVMALPGGARIVVWNVLNLEYWDIANPMARQVLPAPTGQTFLPDVPNWSWHEYGMRVGFWRLHELYERFGIRPTLSINARVCEDYERVARAGRDGKWEFMGHSYQQGPIHKEADPAGMIRRSLDVIERYTGTRPTGWLGPGLTQTLDTPDQLAEAGIRWMGDWVYDDLPTRIRTAHGPLVTIPYSIETNDITVMIVQHHEASYWARKCIDTFDRLYEEGATRPRVMTIAMHPYISGQPFRIKYVEEVYRHMSSHAGVLHWQGAQIQDWYSSGGQ